ncbi:MAG: glycosyltransferase family 4 protein, partial [Candidatus Margulisbacteria bacterium]|nr:glycosyltransferase family 4 protein [Candidatus Margulisiibacteriota bacterium]
MKVVVLGLRGIPNIQGGVESHCENLYPYLVKLGCDVTIFIRACYYKNNQLPKEYKSVKLIPLWCPRSKNLETFVHTFLASLKVKKLKPDIVHIHAIGPSLLVPFLKAQGLKVVMTHHGPDYERKKWGKITKVFLKLGEKNGVKNCDRLITVSNRLKEEIYKKYGITAIHIPSGVNISEAIPPGEELKRWNLEPKKYVFTACRFVPEKGLHDLIEAYKNIKNPPFKLVIAGDADQETEYSRNLKEMAKNTPGVVLTGFIKEKRLGELFSNAGLFVLPSYYEEFSIAVLEALSYGLPILLSDIPQNKEIVFEKNKYFKTGDVKQLEKKLIENYSLGITDLEKKKYRDLVKNEY